MIHTRLMSVMLAGLLAVSLVGPALPRAEAADAQFVLHALGTLQENYVNKLPSVPLLNAALESLQRKTGAAAFDGPIPEGTSDAYAASMFVQRFDEILTKTGDRYSATDLAYAATAGMLQSLHDSHTGFIPPDIYQEVKRQERGQAAFTGIGIVLLAREGRFYAQEVYPESPAANAGLRAFDRVVAINGRTTNGLDAGAVSSMIRGPAGTSVVLTVERSGTAGPVDLTIVRSPIRVPSVTSRMLDDTVGYIKIFEFVPGVGRGFRDAIFALRRSGMQALILDLRGNPGGFVDELRDVSSAVLPQSSPVLQMTTRVGRTAVLETPDPPILPSAVPIVALVDEETGSAAELLAAALKEQNRATIAGAKTAGAVEIGITVDLPEGAGMSITVARVMSGKGTRLEGQGVVPQVVADLTTTAMNLGRDSQLDKALEMLHRTLGSRVESRHVPVHGGRLPAAA